MNQRDLETTKGSSATDTVLRVTVTSLAPPFRVWSASDEYFLGATSLFLCATTVVLEDQQLTASF